MLSDIELIEALSKYNGYEISDHVTPGSYGLGDRMYLIILWSSISFLIAGLIGFSISYIICRRNKIFWFNAFLVLMLTFIVCKTHVLNLNAVKTISDAPGTLFDSFGLYYSYMVNGIVPVIAGLILFLNRWTKRMILKQYPEEHFATEKVLVADSMQG